MMCGKGFDSLAKMIKLDGLRSFSNLLEAMGWSKTSNMQVRGGANTVLASPCRLYLKTTWKQISLKFWSLEVPAISGGFPEYNLVFGSSG
jgi:hypothetical protein